MKFLETVVVLVASTAASAATGCLGELPPFPSTSAYPKSPAGFQLSSGPHRERVCVVKPGDTDAGPAILEAARNCNQGGTVYLPNGTYQILTPLDLTFLDHIDFAIFGTINFGNDVTFWPGKTFNYPYQSVSLFWRFGGTDVNIYGGGHGVIDGLGQAFWDAMVVDKNVLRPTLLGTDGLHRSTITGISMRNSPGWFNFISNSSNVLISDFDLNVLQTNKSAPAKNTDGWDTFRSSNIVIQNSRINNTDDCVSFKPNSTAVIVQGLDCNGSHGISVGSLGQYRGQVDIVEDIYVYNITMSKASDGARIKVWPGVPPGSDDSVSGGGSGRVRNVTYELFHNNGNDHAISISQCYYSKNQTMCDLYPASLKIQDISFLDFSGTTSSKNAPRVGELICSSPDVCTGIVAHNIDVVPAGGGEAFFGCHNFDQSNVDIRCRDPSS
ncbi:exopolygalacturonase [Colletotrichum karsti]|uniref:galacturonan 1,4-alpha-galacturonidase n=1 Tax=Colletotrichum karsti TaxID=1095194 RepID=A0A9P6HU08_9PEZI|nr:exopolygalacturonase [Colletotrichum karsti]KAF9870663.1 exopolygalacturonase [Colletotrichum karsti]